ncbi:ATP-dependent Clp protease adaptor ClpS [Balneola sp. MJW-20]|uniref:ATP-dependent Clp protease adaptor ClpS n=1 Tax=Gracilimonas aurantiaca TaxID=3234185 RepID=UPI0034656C56
MAPLSIHIDPLFSEDPGVEELAETKEETADSVQSPWRLILYDDDIHTFEEVISQLMKATGCSLAKAEELTVKVHNEGKATVYEGDFEECLRIDGVLKEIQLVTEIKG